MSEECSSLCAVGEKCSVTHSGKCAALIKANRRIEKLEARPDYSEPIAYMRDIDGTGSLHACAIDDPGAIPVFGALEVKELSNEAVLETMRGIGDQISDVVALKARIEELEGLLKPFSDFAPKSRLAPRETIITQGSGLAKMQLTMGDCYDAQDALLQKDSEHD